MLSFQKGNAKLDKKVFTFSIPSGYTCPFALDCLSKANPVTGKITDGKQTKFRCFSASQEALFTNVRRSRWKNFDILRVMDSVGMSILIKDSLPKAANIVRIHVGGDFFSQAYFDAWAEVARKNPKVIFYAYTKSLDYWVRRLGSLPPNFVLTASYGGRHDELISQYKLRYAQVVYSEEQAAGLGLEIDHDDRKAMVNGPSFALLIHGTQPAGSNASKKLAKLRKKGYTGYNKKNRVVVELPVLS